MMGLALFLLPEAHGWDRFFLLPMFFIGLNEWRASFTPEKR
jgi:hypothetical protein